MFSVNCTSVNCCVAEPAFRSTHGCFHNILDITCPDSDVIMFDLATYGRNNRQVASQCDVTFDDKCEIDVTMKVKDRCAGRSSCQLHVNTALFSDPCGEEEFVIAHYQCVKREYRLHIITGM